MRIQELKELKSGIIEKYVKNGKQDKELKAIKRIIDKIIKSKLEKIDGGQ